MAEAVILSAIESLDCWLLNKENIQEENVEKMYSLIVGMSDLGEEKKEMVYTLLLQLWMVEERERNETKLYNLLGLNKEKMYSLVVGMAHFWEDHKGKLYYFLFRVAERANEGELNKEKLQSLLVKITDLWGDDEGELDKEKLHSLLFQMLDKENCSEKKMVRRISGEVACLWKDKQPKPNKEKLYIWLASKLDPLEAECIFHLLLDVVLLYDPLYHHKSIGNGVEEAKKKLGQILDLMRDKKLGEESSLRYFFSDVMDMTYHARFLIHLKDSDPYALFFQLTVYLQDLSHTRTELDWFTKEFKHIVRGLKEIKESMIGYGAERLQNFREMEGGENVVELEEDVKLLVSDVLSDETNSEFSTVIYGMAGSGKTTLARQVYNHTTITEQFECRAWVCLSKMISRKEILVSLIRQVVDSNELASLEKIECANCKSLKQVLRQQLLGMRYFIVLDDMWENTTTFEYVIKALRKDKGSRLLLTTRTVNRFFDGVNYHKMKSMDDGKSWKLLLKTLSIEGSDEKFPKPLVKRARQILMRKCGGLPLAIKEVGRHWAKRRQSGSEWEELIESVDLSETLTALESSYHNWHGSFKLLFLHLAFFKEGATIKAKKLAQIWSAMGVLPPYKKMFEDCLRELRKESIVDVIDMDKKHDIKTCCIHPIFRRLSIKKAEDELNFEILSKDGNNRPSHQPRHRVIYCSREKFMNYSSNQDKHLESLFFYGGGYSNVSPSCWKHFEQLKTLDMEDFGLKILPDAIGMLSELRYLGLRNNYIQELPHSLSRLKNLEVLDISLNFMVAVEDTIWELESLCHLYMSDISCQKPLRVDTLKNLMTLTYVSVHNLVYEESSLEMMTGLNKLGVQVDGNTDLSKLFASLAKLQFLECLILRGFRFKSMASLNEIGILQNIYELKLDGLIIRLPSANNLPPKLWFLSLVNSCLHEDPMLILKELTLLTYLKLQNAYTGQQMVISEDGFSNLQSLVIEELWHLSNVQIEKGAMKMLTQLEINNCPNLETLPDDYCP